VTSVDSSTAADRRFRAWPDGGKLTALPPVVRQPGGGAADATSQDVRADAERWGGGRRGGCFSWRERERRAEVGGSDLSMVVNNGWLFLDHTAKDSSKVMAGS
jgi:hypothetical protein